LLLRHAADTLESSHILHSRLLRLTAQTCQGLTKAHLCRAERLTSGRLLLTDLTKLSGELTRYI
jgi:hypothetical protein